MGERGKGEKGIREKGKRGGKGIREKGKKGKKGKREKGEKRKKREKSLWFHDDGPERLGISL